MNSHNGMLSPASASAFQYAMAPDQDGRSNAVYEGEEQTRDEGIDSSNHSTYDNNGIDPPSQANQQYSQKEGAVGHRPPIPPRPVPKHIGGGAPSAAEGIEMASYNSPFRYGNGQHVNEANEEKQYSDNGMGDTGGDQYEGEPTHQDGYGYY